MSLSRTNNNSRKPQKRVTQTTVKSKKTDSARHKPHSNHSKPLKIKLRYWLLAAIVGYVSYNYADPLYKSYIATTQHISSYWTQLQRWFIGPSPTYDQTVLVQFYPARLKLKQE